MLSASYALHAERDEAFGIAIAEYLKAGNVPIIPDEGGPTEIVDDKELTFKTIDQAAETLAKLLADDSFRAEKQRHCVERAKEFTLQAYMERQRKLLKNIVHSAETEK